MDFLISSFFFSSPQRLQKKKPDAAIVVEAFQAKPKAEPKTEVKDIGITNKACEDVPAKMPANPWGAVPRKKLPKKPIPEF
jgi:hypothetical protein